MAKALFRSGFCGITADEISHRFCPGGIGNVGHLAYCRCVCHGPDVPEDDPRPKPRPQRPETE